MSLFDDSSNPKPYGRALAELLLIGGVQLEILAKGKSSVTYEDWSKMVREATTQPGRSLEDRQLEWLWEALTTEPRISMEFGSWILSREEEWKRRKPVLVFKKETQRGQVRS